VAEAVVDGETGLLVPPDDPEALARAVRELLDDPERRRELGHRGRERALADFGVDAMARAYETLYAEVVR
jgi:starch synthase